MVVVSPNSQWNWIPSNIWVGVGKMTAKQVTFPLAPVYRRKGITYRQAKAVAVRPEGDADDARPARRRRPHLPRAGGRDRADPLRLPGQRDRPKLELRRHPGSRPGRATRCPCARPATPSRPPRRWTGSSRSCAPASRSGSSSAWATARCTCEGAAFEYTFNVEHELRAAGVRDLAEIVYLSNEYELGDFGVGGMVFDQRGFVTSSQTWTESLFRERGVRAILRAHVERVEPGKVFYETLDGDAREPHLRLRDAAAAVPRRRPDGVRRAGRRHHRPAVRAQRLPQGRRRLHAQAVRRVARRGLALDLPVTRPTATSSASASRSRRRTRSPGRARAPTARSSPRRRRAPGCRRASWAARSRAAIADMIQNGATAPTHTASMSDMGAACVASAGTGLRHGSAAAMTMYPVVPDYQKYPRGGRSLTDTSGEIGLAGHWIKHLLHFLFIYKAKARPGWYLIPE